MWEIFSGGKSPYPGTNPVSLMQMLERGERMPKPYNLACSDEMLATLPGYYKANNHAFPPPTVT